MSAVRSPNALLPPGDWEPAPLPLASVLASIDDHVACYDRQWRFTFVNDKAAVVLGKSKAELLGRSVWDVFPDAVDNLFYRALHEAVAQQKVVHFENYYAPLDTWFENHV